MLNAVIFDLDDTLIDWSNHSADWHELLREYLQPVHKHLSEEGHTVPSLEEFTSVYREINRLAWAASVPPDWIAPNQRDVLRNALRAVEVDAASLDLDHLQKLFGWGLMPGVEVFPDAKPVLEKLRAEDVRVGLMTNASSPMWMRDRELKSLNLLSYFDARTTAGDVGHLKPHRRAFEAVLEKLDVRPENAVFVGDRQHDDVTGAQAVGMKAVWVRRGTEEKVDDIEPDAVIDRLKELLDVLDKWYPDWR